MGYTLKDILANVVELPQEEENEKLHRTKKITERPNDEVKLYSIAQENAEVIKTQADPTDDLVEVGVGSENVEKLVGIESGYLIWCQDTLQMWYAHDKTCLDKNFIYRDDLKILEVHNNKEAVAFYDEKASQYNPGIVTRKACYLLDIPGNETYEVYYDTTYPNVHYGKVTPSGMFVHKYKDRFHRDMAILNLDKIYSEASGRQAGKFTAKKFKPNEAVIISDGAWMKDSCTSAHYYIDNASVIKMVEGTIPSELDQAVLISEITAAYNALMMCYMRKKTYITYYYDNTSILNVFKNRKTEYIEEIKRYKDFLEQMDKEGYRIIFVELHPKTDDNKDDINKALVFFHNSCDSECRIMADTIKKDYKSYLEENPTNPKDYRTMRQENKPKGRPKYQGNNRR